MYVLYGIKTFFLNFQLKKTLVFDLFNMKENEKLVLDSRGTVIAAEVCLLFKLKRCLPFSLFHISIYKVCPIINDKNMATLYYMTKWPIFVIIISIKYLLIWCYLLIWNIGLSVVYIRRPIFLLVFMSISENGFISTQNKQVPKYIYYKFHVIIRTLVNYFLPKYD